MRPLPGRPPQTLTRKERLNRHLDFRACFRFGRRLVLPGMTVVYRPNNKGYRRLGLSVGRRVGPAVRRNRAKRILREIFRRNKDLFPEGHDLVFIPGEDFFDYRWKEHLQHLQDAFYSL